MQQPQSAADGGMPVVYVAPLLMIVVGILLLSFRGAPSLPPLSWPAEPWSWIALACQLLAIILTVQTQAKPLLALSSRRWLFRLALMMTGLGCLIQLAVVATLIVYRCQVIVPEDLFTIMGALSLGYGICQTLPLLGPTVKGFLLTD